MRGNEGLYLIHPNPSGTMANFSSIWWEEDGNHSMNSTFFGLVFGLIFTLFVFLLLGLVCA
jgi:hypothetical protein